MENTESPEMLALQEAILVDARMFESELEERIRRAIDTEVHPLSIAMAAGSVLMRMTAMLVATANPPLSNDQWVEGVIDMIQSTRADVEPTLNQARASFAALQIGEAV